MFKRLLEGVDGLGVDTGSENNVACLPIVLRIFWIAQDVLICLPGSSLSLDIYIYIYIYLSLSLSLSLSLYIYIYTICIHYIYMRVYIHRMSYVRSVCMSFCLSLSICYVTLPWTHFMGGCITQMTEPNK